MKQKPMIEFNLVEPVFNTNIWVFANCTIQEASERCHKLTPEFPKIIKDGEEPEAAYGLYCWRRNKEGKRMRVLWIEKAEDIATIVHECFHATVEVMDARELKLDGAEEAFAWYLDYLFAAVHKRLILKKK